MSAGDWKALREGLECYSGGCNPQGYTDALAALARLEAEERDADAMRDTAYEQRDAATERAEATERARDSWRKEAEHEKEMREKAEAEVEATRAELQTECNDKTDVIQQLHAEVDSLRMEVAHRIYERRVAEDRAAATDAEVKRLRCVACDLCGKGWPIKDGDHVPPGPLEDGWDLRCEALP